MEYLNLIIDSIGLGVLLFAFPIMLIVSLCGLTSEFPTPLRKDNPTSSTKGESIKAYIVTILADIVFIASGIQQFISLKDDINNGTDIVITIITVILTWIGIILLYFAIIGISDYIEYNYTVVKKGELIRAGVKNVNSEGSFIFPESVTKFDTYAFYYNANIFRQIIIPNTVKKIESFQFKSCKNLEKIFIPDTVIEIDADYFTGPASLKELIVDKNNPNYLSEDGVLFNKDKTVLLMYPGGKQNETYSIPEGIVKIKSDAFMNCINLKSIYIPSTLIKDRISILPNSIELKEFVVSEKNPDYSSVDGILFDKEQKILYRFPASKTCDTYIVPETVKKIDSNAFCKCKNLKTIILPSNLKNKSVEFWDKENYNIKFNDNT